MFYNSRVSAALTLAFVLSGHWRDCGSRVITCRLIARTWPKVFVLLSVKKKKVYKKWQRRRVAMTSAELFSGRRESGAE